MNNIAIKVSQLGKFYEIYGQPQDRFKQMFTWGDKRYCRDFWALRDINFEVNKGETLGIIGANGSGKSTLLQILSGTLSATTGRFKINGKITSLLELGSGFNPEFTGRENIYLNGLILGFSSKQMEQKFDEIVAFAEIGDFIEQPVKTYSSGMFVRLAFAVQASLEPDIFIVDEALAVGDAYFVHRCMLRFHEMQEKGTTILLVSHDAGTIKKLCHRAIWLDHGEIKMIGDATRISDEYLSSVFNLPVVPTTEEKLNITHSYEENIHESNIPNIDRRTGNQILSIVGVGLYDTSLKPISSTLNNKEIILRITVKNNSLEEALPLIIGYTFRDSKGVDISSSNSFVTNADLGYCPLGELRTIEAKIYLPLLYPHSYSISPGIGYINNTGTEVETDKIENAIVFEIFSTEKIYILMRFNTTFSIVDSNRKEL